MTALLPEAPLYADLAQGPDGGAAYWLTAADGLRLRIAVWGAGEKGTVLLFPGRTEYIEKYGRAAGDLRARGYACVVIDWRGQGLADRMTPNRMIGHVGRFADYQQDVAAVMDAVGLLGLPKPLYLLSHSMGGAIALRSLLNGLPVRAAVFSAPMWGIAMQPVLRPLVPGLTRLARWLGQSERRVPSTSGQTYVVEAEFGGNVLTTDPQMWHYMRRQLLERPELQLAGPSVGWLSEAMAECSALSLAPAPPYPALTALGTAEKVVATGPIHQRMAGWRGGRLELFQGAEHEVPMEQPALRARFFDLAAALFGQHR